MPINALLSLLAPSLIRSIGTNLLLVGLAGEVAAAVAGISKKRFQTTEKILGIIFGLMILAGVWLEYVADQPRTLDSAAQTRLSESLKKFKGTPFDFLVQLDPESVALMESIADALTSAGWVRQPFGGFGFRNPGKPAAGITAFAGLEIQIVDSKQSEWGQEGQAATALWHSLQKERITVTAKHVPDDQETASAIHIKVGAKP
jgi:hypothetical protein